MGLRDVRSIAFLFLFHFIWDSNSIYVISFCRLASCLFHTSARVQGDACAWPSDTLLTAFSPWLTDITLPYIPTVHQTIHLWVKFSISASLQILDSLLYNVLLTAVWVLQLPQKRHHGSYLDASYLSEP